MSRLFRAGCLDAPHRGTLCERVYWGLLKQHGRGVYSEPLARFTDTEAVLFRTPHAIATLDTALWLNGARATEPSTVWIAISQDARRPRFAPLAIETLRWSRPPPPEDVVVFHDADGNELRSFTLAKTAVDFIRSRRRVGEVRAYTIVDLLLRDRLTEPDLIASAARNRAVHPVRAYLARAERWR